MNNNYKETFTAVSVTVPLYNSSKYLRQCLDSLKSQTLNEIEFILVNDGSTDDSGKICDEYASQDSRFIVIHQENKGSALARQTGLNKSKGEYIIVCDSDDWVEPDMYEKLYNKAKQTNADIVTCDYFVEYINSRESITTHKYQSKNSEDLMKEAINAKSHMSWNKLIRKNLFISTNTTYTAGINLGEDFLIFFKLLNGNPKIEYLPLNLYHYRKLLTGGSYTTSLSMNSIRQMNYTYEWLKNNYYNIIGEELIQKKAINIIVACLRVDNIDRKYYNNFLTTELTYKRLFKAFKDRRWTLAILCKLLPYNIVKKILNYIYKYPQIHK